MEHRGSSGISSYGSIFRYYLGSFLHVYSANIGVMQLLFMLKFSLQFMPMNLFMLEVGQIFGQSMTPSAWSKLYKCESDSLET
jgi:hypothetical protein